VVLEYFDIESTDGLGLTSGFGRNQLLIGPLKVGQKTYYQKLDL